MAANVNHRRKVFGVLPDSTINEEETDSAICFETSSLEEDCPIAALKSELQGLHFMTIMKGFIVSVTSAAIFIAIELI